MLRSSSARTAFALASVLIALIPARQVAAAEAAAWPPTEPPCRSVSVLIPHDRTVGRFEFEGDGSKNISFEYIGDGFFRGARVARFIETPFAPAAERTAGAAEAMDVHVEGGTIHLWLAPATDMPLTTQFPDPAAEEETRALLASLVANAPDYQVSAKALRLGPPGGFAPTDLPSLDGSPVEFVIITNDEMTPAFQELADLRTRFGRSAVVRTVSWIESNYPDGTDLPERIRHFLRDAYTLWGTRWALMGADTEILPVRFIRSQLYDPAGQFVATDMYYSCLDGNWNANGDSYFGEPDRVVNQIPVPGDEVDFYPEIYVGRVPVTTLAEAQAVVDKLENYWLTPPAAYLNKLIYLAEVLSPSGWEQGQPVYLDGASLANMLAAHVTTMNVTKMFENYTAYPGSVPESRQAAIDAIQSGYGWVHHIGHGFKYNMSVGAGNLYNADADAFTNGPKYCVLYAMNCSSAAVHYSCIGEHMLRNPTGGAVAFLGATDLDLPTISLYYEDGFYQAVFQNGIRELGRCLSLAKIPMIVDAERGDNGYRFNQFSLILLGDPTLPAYIADPGTLAVTHSSQFTIGAPSYNVHVEYQSAPVESVFVCLDKGTDAYMTAYTNASGNASFAWTAHTPGTFKVSAFRRDRRPYQGTATAVSSAQAFLHVSNVAITSDGPAPKTSQMMLPNGQADAGEQVSLAITLANTGGVTATGVTAVLRTTDPYASIADSTSTYGSIVWGESATGDVFVVDLSRSTPDRHEIRFEVVATAPGKTWTDTFDLLVTAPELGVYGLTINDGPPGGDGNGQADPGETVDLILSLRNDGAGAAEQVRATLAAVGGGVVMITSQSAFGTVPATTSASGTAFRFTTSVPQPAFEVTVTDTFATLFTRALDLSAPSAPTGLAATGATSSITLMWTKSAAADLAGYHVYRSASEGGPFARINGSLLDKSAIFVNESLPPLARFYYRVAAMDSSGNQSPQSATAAASTSPPQLAGWPVVTDMQVASTGPKIVDLDNNTTPEIIVGSGNMFAFRADGTEFIDGDSTAITLGVFSSLGNKFWSSPAIADLDHNGVLDIAAHSWETDTAGDEKIYVWNATGQLRSGWPKAIGHNPWSSPAFGDIDRDGAMEIVVVSGDAKICAWHADGTEVRDGDSNPATDGVFFVMSGDYTYGSPALGDVDGDGLMEIVATERLQSGDTSQTKMYVLNGDGTSVAGFPAVLGGPSTSSPALADVNNDNLPEIVVATTTTVRVYGRNGVMLSGWPKSLSLNTDFMSSAAVADLDADGDLDIVIGSADGKVYAWQANNAAVLPGFPVDLGGGTAHVMQSPTVGNLDADSQLEIVIPDRLGRVYALDQDGTVISGFPFVAAAEICGSAAIADLDLDGSNDIIAYSGDRNIYVLDLANAPTSVQARAWTMFRLNPAGTGWLGQPASGVGVPNTDGALPGPVLWQNRPNPVAPFTAITFEVPSGEARTRIALRLFDATGRLVRELMNEEVASGAHTVTWDGRNGHGDLVPAGVYFYQATFEGASKQELSRKLVVVR
jgi:hypothetical protein